MDNPKLIKLSKCGENFHLMMKERYRTTDWLTNLHARAFYCLLQVIMLSLQLSALLFKS